MTLKDFLMVIVTPLVFSLLSTVIFGFSSIGLLISYVVFLFLMIEINKYIN